MIAVIVDRGEKDTSKFGIKSCLNLKCSLEILDSSITPSMLARTSLLAFMVERPFYNSLTFTVSPGCGEVAHSSTGWLTSVLEG